MKKILSVLLVVFMFVVVSAGCNAVPEADFEDPQAVFDAYAADHSLEGDSVADISTVFTGKTVCVKTNEKDEPLFTLYKKVTLYTGLYVIFDDPERSAATGFDYNVGDTLAFEISSIMIRAHQNGQYWDFFINVKVPD